MKTDKMTKVQGGPKGYSHLEITEVKIQVPLQCTPAGLIGCYNLILLPRNQSVWGHKEKDGKARARKREMEKEKKGEIKRSRVKGEIDSENTRVIFLHPVN